METTALIAAVLISLAAGCAMLIAACDYDDEGDE
jgi:hypothetical protein